MSMRSYCDGCGAELGLCPAGREMPWRAVHGEKRTRKNAPGDQFDWCERCAVTAFDAVAERKRVAVDGGTVMR